MTKRTLRDVEPVDLVEPGIEPANDTTPPEFAHQQPEPARVNIAPIFDLPAIYANQFFLTQTGAGYRLTFVESVEGVPLPRAAVLMSLQDTMALGNFLNQQMSALLMQMQGGRPN